MATSIRDALFSPKAVALIGASGDAAKNTARPQRYLKKHGYAGKVFPIVNKAVARMGGHLVLRNHPQGGLVAELTLQRG